MGVYKTEEINGIRKSGQIAAQILRELVALARPGIATKELDRVAKRRIELAKAVPAFEMYENFPAVLCTSINEITVHAPPSDRILKEGDLLSLDFGVIADGWYSDVAVTVPIGKVSDEAARLTACTREALERGIAQAVIGNLTGDISAAIQQHVETAGFHVIRELAGHGIGRTLHEPPEVANFGKIGSGAELVEGMVIAIEPITAVSTQHVKQASDGFSYVTTDGSLSAHFEHTVVITKNGPEILTLP